MGCNYRLRQIAEATRAYTSLSGLGVSARLPAMQTLLSIRTRLMARVGLVFPRSITMLIRLIGLSPGSITLWHDIEMGFMTEARANETAPPVYKHASDQVAAILLKGELTKDLELELMTPDDYLGE